MTKRDEAILAAAQAMAGFFGPDWDCMPKGKVELRELVGAGHRAFDCNTPTQDDLLEAARAGFNAILKVIAEPDAEMVEAGGDALMRGASLADKSNRGYARHAFEAMIHKLMGGGE